MSMAAIENLGYTFNADAKGVAVSSDFYIPFEPKRARPGIREKVLELYDEVRQAIRCLEVEDSEILLASYEENIKNRFYDVENMLFYNIGTSVFRNCCQEQLAFVGDAERFVRPELLHTDTEEKYRYSYRVVKSNEVETLLNSKKIVARWSDIPLDLCVPQSPARYYSAIRQNSHRINVYSMMGENTLFGLKLEITLPFRSFPASVMKPAVDGVICAFHGEDETVLPVLQSLFGSAAEEMVQNSNRLGLLGNRAYIQQYRGSGSYKWNPKDEYLQFAWISVKFGAQARMSGTIVEWI